MVKTVVARTYYGAICKLKIYRRGKGVWERFSQHITRVKCESDLHILQGTLHNYETMLQYMYDNTHMIDTDMDTH